MKKISFLLIVFALSLSSCKNEKKAEKPIESEPVVEEVKVETPKSITATLSAKSDSNVSGEVMFKEVNGTVEMSAVMSGLTPGVHAIHLHQTADCSSNDGKSTGGHWNPTNQPHGKWGAEEGYHKGDIGNFTADENGNGMVKFSTNEWCIGCDDDTKNIVGKAVIVHAGEDDLTSQPSGAAGARVSCAGVIE
ncbi:superoxide dismutase family protein [Hyunsoonleella aestuarii]|uniref:Superoxide dismutase family protein n=1 Tax=Hyunsoonleella aestuarii TaxID=912802 RepID=A0ABP8EEX5_9FLAO|nr:superoxide dismutase family protein [Hyunsoonleella aestuarii]